MKNNKIKFLSLFKLFKDNIVQEAMISLNNSFELLALYRKLGWRIVRTIFNTKKTQSRMRTMHIFFQYILKLRKIHGDVYVVKYLKTTQLAIQKCIAGERINSLRELEPTLSFPRVSNSGLPMIIPLSDRRAIKNKSIPVIRFWLTLFSLYRIVSIPGELKLQTITDPYSGSVESLGRVFDDLKFLSLKLSSRFPKDIARKDMGISLLETASPSYSTSWAGLLKDPLALAKAGLGKVALDYMYGMGYSKLLQYWVTIFRHASFLETVTVPFNKDTDNVGQLSTKKEAAGKIRVFAMVDVWTQSLLKPLHLALFSFLKSLPNDGTFDQTASWKRCMSKSIQSNCSFGYDLSAATDRLPIKLQEAILQSWIGVDNATNWAALLVKRNYALKWDWKDNGVEYNRYFRYSVGQPMGALSSWAMLAVTHHFLVQIAYTRTLGYIPVKYTWYENYELLGDDIIIFDKDVATAYLGLMAEIGVPINLSKSVVASNSTTEFAKVTTHFGHNVSALSWKMFISQNTLMGRVNILWNLIHKDYLPLRQLGNWFKHVTAKNRYKFGLENLVFFPILTMMAGQHKIGFEHLLRSVYTRDIATSNTKKALIVGTNTEYLRNLVISYIQGKELRFMSLPIHWEKEMAIFKGLLVRRLKLHSSSVTPYETHHEVGQRITNLLLQEPLKVLEKIESGKYPVLSFNLAMKIQAAHVSLSHMIKDIIFDHVKPLDFEFRPNYLSYTIEEIIDLGDKLQRFEEIKQLDTRALDKSIGKKKELKRTSEIQIIKSVLGMRKFVITWPHMRYESETTTS